MCVNYRHWAAEVFEDTDMFLWDEIEHGWRKVTDNTTFTATTTHTTTTSTRPHGPMYIRKYKWKLKHLMYKYLTRLIDYLFLE